MAVRVAINGFGRIGRNVLRAVVESQRQITGMRAGVAVALAACLAIDRSAATDWCATAAALGLAASLAWLGHAGATLGETVEVHLASDVLHLWAAAAWIGGLISLIVLFATVRRTVAWAFLAHDATRRFSVVGIASVTALLVTGIVNAYILVGSLQGLFVTDYGRVLLLKLGIVAVMLAFASMNRFGLLDRLTPGSDESIQGDSLRRLTRNCVIETVLGLVILAIVALLGTMHPAIHFIHPPGISIGSGQEYVPTLVYGGPDLSATSAGSTAVVRNGSRERSPGDASPILGAMRSDPERATPTETTRMTTIRPGQIRTRLSLAHLANHPDRILLPPIERRRPAPSS